MRLFTLIYNGIYNENKDDICEIIVQFQPLINSYCKNKYTGMIDEDLVDEMYLTLHNSKKILIFIDNMLCF